MICHFQSAIVVKCEESENSAIHKLFFEDFIVPEPSLVWKCRLSGVLELGALEWETMKEKHKKNVYY